MAIIGGIYVWVETEDIGTTVDVAEHPVESGVSITSHIKPNPATLDIRGEIVGPQHQETVAYFRDLARGGYVASYIGRHIFPVAYISSFSTRASGEIENGVAFDMTLKEMRIARSSYVADAAYSGDLVISTMHYDGTTTVENLSERKERYHALMPGETMYFVAEQYRSRGVTVGALRDLNQNRPIFRAGHTGDYDYVLPDARLLLGVW